MTPTDPSAAHPDALRAAIGNANRLDESNIVHNLQRRRILSPDQGALARKNSFEIVRSIRSERKFGAVSRFLTEYGLSSAEGVRLMCLAEALLRVPDNATIDTLIRDRICAGDWKYHIGKSDSAIVNLSTRALELTAAIVDQHGHSETDGALRSKLQKLVVPAVRLCATRITRFSASQFILGTTIHKALARSSKRTRQGYRYSYDMLGEAAMTSKDAQRYRDAYSEAIRLLSRRSQTSDIRDNPGISVKLSALTPRFQCSQSSLVLQSLTDSVLELVRLAKDANMGLNIDAEEVDKLDLTLDVIERVLQSELLKDFNGFGVVVQAYCLHASEMIEWLHALAERYDRRIMVRLVKGAYWDTEIKHAQVLGVESFPVFTRKCSTDVSFLACAKRLLELNDRIYPQFATHNVHSICSIMAMVGKHQRFEFQRLHGMGEEIHRVGRKLFRYPCRIYAPVGAHEDLLAYLVRRILENGVNSSFVNQIADSGVAIETIVSDPTDAVSKLEHAIVNPSIDQPSQLFAPDRINSRGIDLERRSELEALYDGISRFSEVRWSAKPGLSTTSADSTAIQARNPARPDDVVGTVIETSIDSIGDLILQARNGFQSWHAALAATRAEALNRLADLYEASAHELIALMIRETGKTVSDSIAELREAVDFCRYYANEAMRLESIASSDARGIIVCISPWNFPLAIFTGQITAALAAGNSVLAKPAEQSALTASVAVDLMHQVGIPENVIQLVPGNGETVGAALVGDSRVDGICFTGSTQTARLILKTMTESGNSQAPFIAETGGLNAMIVDSTALPEQAVRDIIASAFASCGQRCSALRMLYVQKDIADRLLDMLFGAMDELRVGDPWFVSTDVGPAIDEEAQQALLSYCKSMTDAGHLMHQTSIAKQSPGSFVPPTAFRVSGIEQLEDEVFGPILHIATFDSADIPMILQSVNARGYGLTFGLHTRIEERAETISTNVDAGNIYVNRNQIGAVVGSQPFGGRGLSGTGPKAGGPYYVSRMRDFGQSDNGGRIGCEADRSDLRALLEMVAMRQSGWISEPDRFDRLNSVLGNRSDLVRCIEFANRHTPPLQELDGPTGELNHLRLGPKGVFICIGSIEHVLHALLAGNAVLAVRIDDALLGKLLESDLPVVSSDVLPDKNTLTYSEHLAGVAVGNCCAELKRKLRIELAARLGPIIGLVTERNVPWQFCFEKSICTDITAGGGNARLLVESTDAHPNSKSETHPIRAT
ncbi:MAG: bifunctional proline dehydrogenase/L-glutamate gamma-semialdehyde dehydrogenase PutA [Acidiferrobacterales bacterium]|nr:bifunctional proline dehydrogenase/L-glutamate gamma-semialdehyde dehydrogenase PutA [Acidiferrobacterales bacterium]